MIKATIKFLKFLKELNREKSCKKINVLEQILKDLLENTEKGLFNFHNDRELGLYLFKKRVKHPCERKGKSGGLRIIFALYCSENSEIVILITLYSKSERENIQPHEVVEILKKIELKNLEVDERQLANLIKILKRFVN